MPAEALFRADAYLKSCTARVVYSGADGIRLDRTIFYAAGGGQPGDTGTMKWNSGEARILDTRKFRDEGEAEDITHILAEASPLPSPGTEVEILLDWERRHAHMRMHTCLHLLSAIFRDAPVTGGQVGAEKSRLDFDLSDVPGKEHIASELNRL